MTIKIQAKRNKEQAQQKPSRRKSNPREARSKQNRTLVETAIRNKIQAKMNKTCKARETPNLTQEKRKSNPRETRDNNDRDKNCNNINLINNNDDVDDPL
eukprot:1370032-Amphidinium_carterae.1